MYEKGVKKYVSTYKIREDRRKYWFKRCEPAKQKRNNAQKRTEITIVKKQRLQIGEN